MTSTTSLPPRARPLRPCPNCGDPAPGRYCPTCGQRKVDVRVSVWSMLREALDDQLSLNSALPRTLAALFLWPGKLTEEYVRGRIVRYVPPFRLYLMASIVCFLTLAVVDEASVFEMGSGDDPSRDAPVSVRIDEEEGARREEAAPGVETLPGEEMPPGEESDPVEDTWPAEETDWLHMEVNEEDNAIVAWGKRRLLRLNEMEREEAGRAIGEGVRNRLPTGVFLLVPAFALLLGFAYLDRHRYFVEHFVFALHVHAAGFLLITLSRLGEALFRAEWLGGLTLLLILLYLFVALRRVYQGSRFGTALRMLFLLMSYGAALMAVLVGVVLFTVFLL